jgi:hypothetical protein
VGAQYRYLLEHLESYLRGPIVMLEEPNDTASPASHVEPPAIDRPKRAVHHRAFYSLHRGARR